MRRHEMRVGFISDQGICPVPLSFSYAVCFLSLYLWRTLEHWMGISDLGDEARQFLLEMRQLHSMNIHLPTKQGPTIRFRVVSKPEKELAVLLGRLKLRLPNVPLKLEM